MAPTQQFNSIYNENDQLNISFNVKKNSVKQYLYTILSDMLVQLELIHIIKSQQNQKSNKDKCIIQLIDTIQNAIEDISSGSDPLRTLAQYIKQEKSVQNKNAQSVQREKQALQKLANVKLSLTNATAKALQDTQDRDSAISQLKETIQEINAIMASEQKYLTRTTLAFDQCEQSMKQTHERHLNAEISKLRHRITTEHKSHTLFSAYLNEQRAKNDQEIQYWMHKFDTDTDQITATINQLKLDRVTMNDSFEDTVVQFHNLQEQVDTHVSSQNQILLLKKQKRMAELHVFSARIIQRWWRRMLSTKFPNRKVASSKKPGSSSKSKKKPSTSSKSKSKK